MDDRNRSSILQWILPTAVMMIVVMVMLFNFSSKSSAEAQDTVSRTLIASTESFSDRFKSQLDGVRTVGRTIRALLEREGIDDKERVTQLLEIAVQCSGAYIY